ncbi:AAA family ATPase [Bosea sp. (in: a-proteobacteria)]|uniref:AAA family ATPase n=1 Tax=Bosea sp. (in: a-proteobacteria) TaxID=1871050 RepID=UPI0027336CC1|nr:AAA family ATPase [Bosea sp. (in: a-proteobacteria)]MDP3410530.1 AAA family ATPase [Bosea sp. (in: a-proteobacteria)]
MIHITHLRLRAITADHVYGTDIPFEAGLNVVQANNTSGKSTSLQAIIYALGLERALGPQLDIPLPYAMREKIHAHEDDEYELVIQSYVEIEIRNHTGRSVVIRRDVVGGKDRRLIQTWAGPGLAANRERSNPHDYYVLDGGAAQAEDGFHRFLTNFIGWELPMVSRFDGSECPLYLEAIFPMLFVEQKRGWSTIQGPFPTFLRIQDVARRVMEFMLDLDVGRIRRRRAELRSAVAATAQRWAHRRTALEDVAQRIGRLRGVPQVPTAEFAHTPEIILEVIRNGEWITLNEAVNGAKARIAELEGVPIESTEDAVPEMTSRLEVVRGDIDSLSAQLEAIRAEHNGEEQERQALRARLQALEADLKRNQDAQKLKRLGSQLGRAAGEHVCPTCHQEVTGELLPAIEAVGMGLDENIAFVKSQMQLYRVALDGVNRKVEDCQVRYRAQDEVLRERQSELRRLRQAILQPSASPSRIAIEEIVRLQSFLERSNSFDEAAEIASEELKAMAFEWSRLQQELKAIPADEFSFEDTQKINSLEISIQKRIGSYGFRSFQPSEIVLSRENQRPLTITRDADGDVVEKEITFEVSASDGIRLKWAYYLSMLRLPGKTNHAGLVIYDEPGQQEIDAQSLYAFLQDGAAEKRSDQQIIISTSEPLPAVHKAVGLNGKVISFSGFILQPL